MSPTPLWLSAVLLATASLQAPLRAQVVEVKNVAVEIRRDSLGSQVERSSLLRLPSQRPWQNDFYVTAEIARLDPKDSLAVQIEIGFDVKMGPQVYGGPDGEVLVRSLIDSLGAWFKSPRSESKRFECEKECPDMLRLGPFPLADVIPGPTGVEATLWATRLRVHVQAFAVRHGGGPLHAAKSTRRSVAVQEIPIR